jgi:hypothetical protein
MFRHLGVLLAGPVASAGVAALEGYYQFGPGFIWQSRGKAIGFLPG